MAGGSAARRLGGSAARRLGGSAARRLGGSAARRLGGSAARRLGGSAARRLGGSAARRLGGSAARRLGGSAARRLGGHYRLSPCGDCQPPGRTFLRRMLQTRHRALVNPVPARQSAHDRIHPSKAIPAHGTRTRGRRLACQPAPKYRWYTKCTPKSNASAAAAMRSPHSRCPPRRRPYPWCVSRPFGTGTRQMVHGKSRRRTSGAFGNGARRAVPHRKPRTARRTSRRFAAEHVRRYPCAEVTRSERWPRHQAMRYFHHASSVRAASPDGRRAQVTSANGKRSVGPGSRRTQG